MPVVRYFPTWTLAELEACRQSCYRTIPIEQVRSRYRFCWGVARFAFNRETSTDIPPIIVAALSDENALEAVKYVGDPSMLALDSHALMHVVVGVNERRTHYQFLGMDLASRYIDKRLVQRYPAEMIAHVQEMLRESRHTNSRHAFQIYGQHVVSFGGKKLKCQNLKTGKSFKLKLDEFGGRRALLKPKIDSLSPQGMFLFTVAAERPMQEVEVLKDLCALYDNPKLYSWCLFKEFAKQTIFEKDGEAAIENLAQYVLELQSSRKNS
ncbi:hypothetical protein HDU81_000509 [Chytriomyces hyalinus]|nr:hypothetical protein HDU81_000509 [Chytriomyces hyalinus]